MTTDKRDSVGRRLGLFFLYVCAGAAIFGVCASWIFTGLHLWGN